MDKQTFLQGYGKLVARTWSEPEFLNEVKNNPVQALGEEGIEVPETVTVRVVVMEPTGQAEADEQYDYWERGDKSGQYDLFIPTKPDNLPSGLRSEGGDTYCCTCTPCCTCT